MLLKGDLMVIHGLTQRTELNGNKSLVISVSGSPDRVKVCTIPDNRILAVRPANLKPLERSRASEITVCCQCSARYWSWETHRHYAGWTRIGRRGKSYMCHECSAQKSGQYAGSPSKDAARDPGSPTPSFVEGHVGRMVQELVEVLNAEFETSGSRPEWMANPTDNNLQKAGRYDSRQGFGDPTELDYGNMAGSVLPLAMLSPNFCGLPAEPKLNIFGSNEELIRLSDCCQRLERASIIDVPMR